jgi:hypothetical protein
MSSAGAAGATVRLHYGNSSSGARDGIKLALLLATPCYSADRKTNKTNRDKKKANSKC